MEIFGATQPAEKNSEVKITKIEEVTAKEMPWSVQELH